LTSITDTCGPSTLRQRWPHWRYDLIVSAAPRLIPEKPVPLPAWRGTHHKDEREGAPMADFGKQPPWTIELEVQVAALGHFVRVAREAEKEARELLKLLDAGHMPTLARRLRERPLRNPYTLDFLAGLIEDRARKRSGKNAADAKHEQKTRPKKRAARDWFETVRRTRGRPNGMTKDDAATEIEHKFDVAWRTARDWLKGV
jgi:hypothetical protein